MTAKEFVLQEYPKAVALNHNGCWVVWHGKITLGVGGDKSSAWTNAKQNIKEQDLSVNPNE